MREAGAYKIAMAADVINRGGAGSVSIGLFDEEEQGLNSIEFQQDVQQGFQLSTLHSVWLKALLNILLNRLLKFN